MSDNNTQVTFGSFQLDTEERVLYCQGREISLQDLPMRLLIELVQQAPQLVTRKALFEALWPPGTHLDVAASLNTAVARAREALGDDASKPRFIATVPRRGYRFLAPVEPLVAPQPANETRQAHSQTGPLEGTQTESELHSASRGTFNSTKGWGLGTLLLLLPAVGFWIFQSLPPSPREEHRVESSGPEQTAQEHLLIARHHSDRRSKEGLEKAIASYQSALAVEPENAEAYSGLASTYALLGIYDYWRPRDAFGPAHTLAQRALELDPLSAEAHLSAGLVAAIAHWDWNSAQGSMARAVELAPTSAALGYWQGALLSSLGHHDKALEATQRAIRLDPTSPLLHTALAWRLFVAGRGADAIEQSHRAIALDPGYFDSWDNLKWIHLTLGNESEAVEAWVRAEQLDNHHGAEIEATYRETGLQGLHRASSQSLVERWETGAYQSPFDIVLEYCALGDRKEALLWLERSFAERETDLIGLATDPRLDLLRSEPRFEKLLEELDYP
ncbi:MAG: tetratricopeptide repeat protein [Deltaproteobacteria bacterium]|nr:tetratricopeptide repeat protein [Deltaproteobacteria bacterium]